MLRNLALLMASSLPTAFLAAPASAETIIGEQDGIHYEYSLTLKKDDEVQFDGVYLNSGERFRMVVSAGGRVRGTVGMRRVHFSVAPEKWGRLVAHLKSRQQLAYAHAGADPRRGE